MIMMIQQFLQVCQCRVAGDSDASVTVTVAAIMNSEPFDVGIEGMPVGIERIAAIMMPSMRYGSSGLGRSDREQGSRVRGSP